MEEFVTKIVVSFPVIFIVFYIIKGVINRFKLSKESWKIILNI